MTGRLCRGCQRPVPSGATAYCSRTCLEQSTVRRRRAAAERARRRRAMASHPTATRKEEPNGSPA